MLRDNEQNGEEPQPQPMYLQVLAMVETCLPIVLIANYINTEIAPYIDDEVEHCGDQLYGYFDI